ncbi:MAG: hypothetical protein M2R45_04326 [Verrucomicrobia subdivision 3 bacterium]|nr:hypothetical protein [Limisphaerales bacterium]MCS1417242.1 hypothetical protein [Limisphaerales bacterium]
MMKLNHFQRFVVIPDVFDVGTGQGFKLTLAALLAVLVLKPAAFSAVTVSKLQ